MSDQDLFVGGDNQTPPDSTSTSNAGDPLIDLVGDGKKFKTASDLARGKLEADRFIAQLQSENKRMREDLKAFEATQTKQQALSEILDEIKKTAQPSQAENQPGVNLDEILKVVDQRVETRERSKVYEANRAKVNAAILNRFNGDSAAARKFLDEKTREFNLGRDQIKELAETSPSALLSLVGINQHRETLPNTVNVPGGTVNSEALANTGNGERNYKYYQELRKKMGVQKFYANFELQKQYHRDLDQLGDKFF